MSVAVGESVDVRYPALTGLRAVAVLSAVIQHAAFANGMTIRPGEESILSSLAAGYEFGPALFFAMSGFLLYRPFAAAHAQAGPVPQLRDFWWRRLLRIVPAYWLALTVLLIPALFGLAHGSAADTLQLYLLTNVYSTRLFYDGIVQSYTLAAEVAFYLVLPAYALAVRRVLTRRPPGAWLRVELGGAVFLAVVACAWRYGAVHWSVFPSIALPGQGEIHIATNWMPAYLDLFAVGMALSVLHVRHALSGRTGAGPVVERMATHPGLCGLGALGAYLVVAFVLDIGAGPVTPTGWEALGRVAMQALAAACLIVPSAFGDLERGGLRRCLSSRPVVYVGTISFGIYLWHNGFIDHALDWVGDGLWRTPFWPMLAIALAGGSAAAAASYHLVERPVMRWKGRFRP